MKALEGKTAVVTGGARGIGEAIARRLVADGCNMVILDIQEDAAKKTAEDLAKSGVKTASYALDVADAEAATEVMKSIAKEFGGIDILVNNAGITRDNVLLRMKEDEWDAVLRVNLRSVYACTKAAARYLLKSPAGRIVNIASVVGVMGNAGQANYSASKAGIIGFTKSCAKEFASRKITANAVAPGFIRTAMTDTLSEDVVNQMLAAIPLASFGEVADVAEAVRFLAGEESRYITGQVIQVDGGMVM